MSEDVTGKERGDGGTASSSIEHQDQNTDIYIHKEEGGVNITSK